MKNSSKNTKYDESKEYDDLDILLSIVKDLKLNMKFAILPANGKWSDYTGIDSEKRQVAYNNLKEIAKKNNIEVMDYSSKEYEEYYMYDAMHLGWRGWIDFERDLYKLKNRMNENQKLMIWIFFFYIIIMGIIIYSFVTDFSNVQEYVYSEF